MAKTIGKAQKRKIRNKRRFNEKRKKMHETHPGWGRYNKHDIAWEWRGAN